MTAISTGFPELDEMTGGVRRSEVAVYAGRPVMGQEILALDTLRHAAVENRRPSLLISPFRPCVLVEKPSGGFLHLNPDRTSRRPNRVALQTRWATVRIRTKLLSGMAGVAPASLRKGRLTEHEQLRVDEARSRLDDAPLSVEVKAGISLSTLEETVARAKEQQDIELLVIDWLPYVFAAGGSKAVRRRLDPSVMHHLRGMASRFDVAIVAVSNVGRGPEYRDDHSPRVSDLADTGEPVSLAAFVLLLYRASYYSPMTTRVDPLWEQAEVSLAWNLRGPTRSLHLPYCVGVSFRSSRCHLA